MNKKPFRTKIPTQYHEKIYEWYCGGTSTLAIQGKLLSDFGYNAARRTLSRLIQHMKDEKQAVTQAAIAHRVQKQVISDFDALNDLFDDVLGVAQAAQSTDHNLFLRATDRLVKLLQIKFALATREEKSTELDSDKAQEIINRLVGS